MTREGLLAFVSCLAFGTPALAQSAPEPSPILVVAISDARVGDPVTAALRSAVVTGLGADVGGHPVRTIEPAAEQAFAACADATCLGGIISRGGAAAAVIVRATRARPRVPVDVQLEVVDAVSGTARIAPGRLQLALTEEAAPGARLAPFLAPIVQAFPPPVAVVPSTLLITLNVDDATVTVGEQEVGRSPLAPLTLSPGQYSIQATADGFAPGSATVTLSGGERGRLDLELRPLDASRLLAGASATDAGEVPIYEQWWLWAAVGGGVVVIAVIIGVIAATTGSATGIPIPRITN